jgi:hypothetical protein
MKSGPKKMHLPGSHAAWSGAHYSGLKPVSSLGAGFNLYRILPARTQTTDPMVNGRHPAPDLFSGS